MTWWSEFWMSMTGRAGEGRVGPFDADRAVRRSAHMRRLLDLDVVARARNNIVWNTWISDDNLDAACGIAQRLVELHTTAVETAMAMEGRT